MIEEPVLDRALAGDEDAFDHLLRPHRNLILNLAFRLTGNREDAKEISQETIFRIFKYLRTFKRSRSFKNWVCRIVINTTNDFWKSSQRINDIMDQQKKGVDIFRSNTPEKEYLNMEIQQKIQICLCALSPKEKSVFLLRDSEGFSIKETSDVLGYSNASVKTHLCRARKKIRIQLEKIYPPKRPREVT